MCIRDSSLNSLILCGEPFNSESDEEFRLLLTTGSRMQQFKIVIHEAFIKLWDPGIHKKMGSSYMQCCSDFLLLSG